MELEFARSLIHVLISIKPGIQITNNTERIHFLFMSEASVFVPIDNEQLFIVYHGQIQSFKTNENC